MSKLKIHRVVFNVTQFDNMLFINIDCFDFNLLGYRITDCNTIYKHELNLDDEKFDTEAFLMIAQINDLLKKIDINHPTCILNIASNKMIFEKFTLPKLTATEVYKSLSVELNKLYPNFENRFIWQYTKLISDGYANKYDVAMLELDLYKKILGWFKDIKVNLISSVVNQSSLRRILMKTEVFKRKRGSVFINMKDNETQIIVNDSKNVDGSVVIDEGYSDFEYAISAILRREQANNPDKKITIDTFLENYPNEDMDELIIKLYNNLIIEVKKIVGNLFLKQNVFKVYFSVENHEDRIVGPTLTRILNIRFSKLNYVKPATLKHLSSYGALGLPNKKNDYVYPIKVK